MKARQLIADHTLDPTQLGVLFRAFDLAWTKLAPGVGVDALAVEAARLRLANAVLAVADGNVIESPELIADTALKVYRAKVAPSKLRQNESD